MEYRKQQFDTYDAFTQQFSCDYSQPLARGGHGEIYRGVDLETNEEVAIKRRLYSADGDLITLEKEFTHTQALPPNRFVVRYVYYGRYVTPFGTFEFLVMKFYRDGNLTHNALPWQQLTEAQRRRFTEEFLKGLAHLHHHQVIHRDIKPENILLVKYIDADGAAYRPVIADFGISKLLSENPEAHTLMQNSMRVGTVTYMAPEQLRALKLSYNADLWAFGIILYEIITGKYMIPRRSFPDLQREEAYTFWRNADDQRFPADMDTIPEPYQQIIRRCLQADPDERVQSTDELLTLLSVQPQLAAVDRLIKGGQLAEAIEQLEAIDSRASLPSVTHQLNELRLQQALDKPVEPELPQSDRPVEFDEEAITPLPVVETIPVTAATPQLPDNDDQRTQQFTEQFDPAWLISEKETANAVAASPLAQFRTQDPIQTTSDPSEKVRTKGGKKAPQPAAQPVAVAESPTPEEPFTAPEANLTNSPTAPAFTDRSTDYPTVQEPAASAPTDDVVAEPTVQTDVVPAQASEPFMASRAYESVADTPTADKPTDFSSGGFAWSAPPAAVSPPSSPVPPLPVRTWRDELDKRSKVLGGQSKRVYERFKTWRHRRTAILVGLALLLGLFLLFSSEPPVQPQTSPAVSADYQKALKLFKTYQVRYEKTGELNPYLWAFEKCNPDYEDSLEIHSAISRAKAMVDYNQLLFPDAEANLSGFKRQEMRHILYNKDRWRRITSPDLNCSPGQLVKDEQANR